MGLDRYHNPVRKKVTQKLPHPTWEEERKESCKYRKVREHVLMMSHCLPYFDTHYALIEKDLFILGPSRYRYPRLRLDEKILGSREPS